jgi:Holliday junction resolvase RusA-like endonuclease
MTAAQLFDAAGEPEAVDQKYFKRFSRETWKYDGESGNRYRTRVTLENGSVVGWDIKS